MKALSKRISDLERHSSRNSGTMIVYIGGYDITKEPVSASVFGVGEVTSKPGEAERDFWIRVHATACAGRTLDSLGETALAAAMRAGETEYEKCAAAPSHGDHVRVTVW